MINNKLVQILGSLNNAELKQFEKFISSPYFNKGRDYLPLLKVLKKFHPGFLNKKLTKEYLYKNIFKEKKYKQTVIDSLLSGLSSLSSEFLIQQDFRENKFKRNIGLLYQLSARNLDKLHDNLFKKTNTELYSGNLHHSFFNMLQELQSHKIQNSFKFNYEKSIKENIPRRGDYFVFAFMTNLLAQVRDLFIMNESLNYKDDRLLALEIFNKINLDELTAYTNKYYPEFAEQFKTIIYCYSASLGNSDDLYRKAEKAFYENFRNLDDLWNMNLLSCLEAGTVIRLMSGKREFIRARHELHKFMIGNNLHIYSDLNYMHPKLTENIIINAVWNKEFEWLEYFIKVHCSEFSSEHAEMLKSLGWSFIHVRNKEYSKALKLIALIPDKLFNFKLLLRNLQLFVYLDLRETELAFNGLDSLRHFARNHKNVSMNLKKAIIDFTYNFEVVLKHISGVKNADLTALKLQLKALQPTLFNDWLIEKIENKE